MIQQSFLAPQDVAPPISLKSCSLIYEPRGRAREYAALACNVYRGCDHGCIYCYAPSATRRQRNKFTASSIRNGNFLARLEKEAAKYQAAGVPDRILLSFTCDPYQHLDVKEQVTRKAIQILHRHGLNVQVLTKGGSRAMRDLDLFTADDAFASTLTLLDAGESSKWEPVAESPQNRIATIKAFHLAGIPTWVSIEPVLDPAAALQIIRQTHSFVNLFKVGKLNYHPLAKSIDWQKFACDAVGLLKSLGCDYYIKKDLAFYLDRQ